MPTVIPERAKILEKPEEPERGWTVVEYRGARLRCWGVANLLDWPEHPFHGMHTGNSAILAHIVDCWLDGKRLPQGYGVLRQK